MNKYLFFFLCLFGLFLKAASPDTATNFFALPSVVQISSTTQSIEDLNKIILKGDVEILLDASTHVWADEIIFDKNANTLHAFSHTSGGVLIETPDMVALADFFDFALDSKTGTASHVRVHAGEKFISARSAYKGENEEWRFKKIHYTACDAHPSDWSFTAELARLKKGMLRAKGILFKLRTVPIAWFPGFIVPAPTHNSQKGGGTSGFLMPKFAMDERLGFGFNQEYYALLAPHVDSLFGVNWRQKKGYVFYDEFRYARSRHDYSTLTAQIASEFNAFVEEGNQVVQTHERRYTLRGKNFQKLHTHIHNVDNLIRFDIGTDRRIDYDFFGRTDAVEDRFLNTFIFRFPGHAQTLDFSLNHDKISRHRFTFTNNTKLEHDEKYSVSRALHVQQDSIFKQCASWFDYQDTFFVDQIFSRRTSAEKLFDNLTIVSRSETVPLEKADTLRLYYQGTVSKSKTIMSNQFRAFVQPSLQVRTRTIEQNDKDRLFEVFERSFFNQGAVRMLAQYGLEWALPQQVQQNSKGYYSHFWQPHIRWQYTPSFNQNNWFFVDEWDSIFPKNELETGLSSDWYFNDIYVGFSVKQSYDFFPQFMIFPLRKGTSNSHFLPTQFDVHLTSEPFFFESAHEFDFSSGDLVQSEWSGGIDYKKFRVALSLLYQKPALQNKRALLSDIPSFGLLDITVPLAPQFKLGYCGHFYSPSNSLIGAFYDPHPLYHRLEGEYIGHCWGISIGFEEKRFRQEGHVKSEQAFTFSIKLDSLGAFSKQFKREPIVLKAPLDYQQ